MVEEKKIWEYFDELDLTDETNLKIIFAKIVGTLEGHNKAYAKLKGLDLEDWQINQATINYLLNLLLSFSKPMKIEKDYYCTWCQRKHRAGTKIAMEHWEFKRKLNENRSI